MIRPTSEWVFVGERSCPHSEKQVKILKDGNLPIRGAVFCDDSAFEGENVCRNVESFPSFCNTKTKKCVSGLMTKGQLTSLFREREREKKP